MINRRFHVSDRPAALQSLEARTLLSATLDFGPADHLSHGETCCCASCLSQSQQSRLEANLLNWGTGYSADSNGMVTDPNGDAFYFDPAPDLIPIVASASDPLASESDGPVEGGSLVPAYNSNPGSSNTIFLDFDGHVDSTNRWINSNDGNPIHAVSYSTNNDIFNFSTTELNNIEEVWARVAEDFAPFDVNVTTVEPSNFNSNSGARLRVLISTDTDDSRVGGSGNRWFSGAGGVAYLNSWNRSQPEPVWVFYNNLGTPKSIAEAASHEAGHALGLNDDGKSSQGYYAGHGSGETGWAPIMGVGYNRTLSQWSRGEYDDANNSEDDLSRITRSTNTFNYRADDHASSLAGATIANPAGETSLNVSGIISRSTDVDVFRFTILGEGTASFVAQNANDGPNLDIQLRLFDASGNEIRTVNGASDADASFGESLMPGTYYLEVDGVGKGNLSSGYSDYGSLGQYDIEITLPSGILGDVDLDGDIDADDIDTLYAAINSSNTDSKFDLNLDGVVSPADGTTLVQDLLGTEFGDANLDGLVSLLDLDALGANFGQAGGWTQGDFNGSGNIDLLDLNILGARWGFGAPAANTASLIAAPDRGAARSSGLGSADRSNLTAGGNDDDSIRQLVR